jgi:retron-type reverse transcriptase
VLANLFLHYAFDAWMAREFPTVPFERYADDAVVHCVSQRQAAYVRRAVTSRMERVGLRLHPDKTQIVYCKDDNRPDAPSQASTSFTFLGYTFRARTARDRNGRRFVAFLPAISKDALKKLGRTVRGWRLHRRTDLSLAELARMINPIIAGWMRYYGAFYRSALSSLLARINTYLVRWIRKKYKRLRAQRKARAAWERVTRQHPGYFAHWAWVRNPLMIKMAGAE